MTTTTGADLDRTALRRVYPVALTSENAPSRRIRTPWPLRDLRAAHLAQPVLGSALWAGVLPDPRGGLRDHWPAIVGPDAAAHWHLAGYNPTTRRRRVLADSPTWAAQLRLHQRRILTDLDQLRPGTVRAIDVRVGPAPVVQHNQDLGDRPTTQPVQPRSPGRVRRGRRRRGGRPTSEAQPHVTGSDPRERGAEQALPWPWLVQEERSPRARGRLPTAVGTVSTSGAIPASAGQTQNGQTLKGQIGINPRERGADVVVRGAVTVRPEQSPRARG
ncbi:DciA family protein [Kitasatospora kazusensis]|uniref:DciA family protein n=1 Tax=Kitasatospora kazusensis TaxID=407974 RepID=UPI003CD07F2F